MTKKNLIRILFVGIITASNGMFAWEPSHPFVVRQKALATRPCDKKNLIRILFCWHSTVDIITANIGMFTGEPRKLRPVIS